MSNRPSQPGPASESPDFPSAASANPLEGIAPLVALATNLAVPDSHGAPDPDSIDELIAAAAGLAPPETPVGEGGGGGAGGGGASAADAITSNGVQLGAGAQHALASAAQDNAAVMTQPEDDVFLVTVGIGHAMDAVL